jgi:flagellin
MYLDILAEDTFSIKGAGIDSLGAITAATSGVSFEYTGTASSLELAASRIKAELNAISQTGKTFNFTTEVVDGRIKITENNGNKFAITGFTSAGSGRIAASVPSEQAASASASAVLLDDATYASSASTSAAGGLKVTDVDMHFGAADDKYSFTISDGTATAAVSVTSVAGYDGVTVADNGDGTDILAAINVALDQAGMSDTVTAEVQAAAASATQGAIITLKHKLGYELTIADFSSVGSQSVKVLAGSNDTTGVAKFLDDNGGGATGATISTISASTSSLAADSIDVIDNALKSVSAERASLGAIQNRLDYTINNLTNISVNTAAAQSRIQDADYAVEAANLAKAQIMQQAGTAMLAQANAMQQTVLSLLQ